MKEYSAVALSRIGPNPKGAVKQLAKLLKDDNLSVRVAATNALEEITGKNVYKNLTNPKKPS